MKAIEFIHDCLYLFSAFICFSPLFLYSPAEGVAVYSIVPWGFLFIVALLVSHVVGNHFDHQFKGVLINDDLIEGKLVLSLMPAKWLINLRMIRSFMYARNIVMPRGTVKNWIQRSWFHGYNFREHARPIDVVLSWMFFALLVSASAISLIEVVYDRIIPLVISWF
jgi:hypothetical protein